MKVNKDTIENRFPVYSIKNILEKEFARGITHFLVFVENILNVLWHAKIAESRKLRKFLKNSQMF